MKSRFDNRATRVLGGLLLGAFTLSACDAGLGIESYNLRGGDPTVKTAPRPKADARGIISYPNYRMVEARAGDTVATLAKRIGIEAGKLASHNGLKSDQKLRGGELLALPSAATLGSGIDIRAIASNAIETAPKPDTKTGGAGASGIEPIRHRVERGETAYSIARLYDVSVTALASWNGLGPDLAVREGQQLLIPIVESRETQDVAIVQPGKGSATPVPPSASKPLPKKVKTEPLPPSPKLGQFKSDDSSRKFLTPVQGKILKPYSGKTGGNEGIDIAASAGAAVKAAEDGVVALISKSVGSNTIVLLRHADNIYTVYANVSDVKLSKGQKIKRGQRLGAVSKGSPSYLHFEVRRGTQSVDPAPFL